MYQYNTIHADIDKMKKDLQTLQDVLSILEEKGLKDSKSYEEINKQYLETLSVLDGIRYAVIIPLSDVVVNAWNNGEIPKEIAGSLEEFASKAYELIDYQKVVIDENTLKQLIKEMQKG